METRRPRRVFEGMARPDRFRRIPISTVAPSPSSLTPSRPVDPKPLALTSVLARRALHRVGDGVSRNGIEMALYIPLDLIHEFFCAV